MGVASARATILEEAHFCPPPPRSGTQIGPGWFGPCLLFAGPKRELGSWELWGPGGHSVHTEGCVGRTWGHLGGASRTWPAGFDRTWVPRTCRLGVLIGSAYFRPAEGTAGLLVYGGITTRGGDGLNRTFGRPFFRPKQGGVDGLNRTFGRPIGRPKVRRADKYAEPQVRFNPVSSRTWRGGGSCERPP